METRTALPKIDVSKAETGCCPRFDPAPWDGAVFDLSPYLFFKARTRSFLHVPLDMAKVFGRAMGAIDAAGARDPDRYLILSRDLSPWKAEHHFLAAKDVPGLESSALRGRFYAKVYEGAFRDMLRWMRDFESASAGMGVKPDEVYAFYTTCPKCAAAYGKNYVVLFGALA